MFEMVLILLPTLIFRVRLALVGILDNSCCRSRRAKGGDSRPDGSPVKRKQRVGQDKTRKCPLKEAIPTRDSYPGGSSIERSF